MNRFGWLISSYLVRTVLPYFFFAWILLSVILFVQQAGRYSDIFFSSNIPKNLIWQLTFALVPNVIAFTCPMAVLIGVVSVCPKCRATASSWQFARLVWEL
jgi:lipopolysaccharide export LptBFGC system permease protein LptF